MGFNLDSMIGAFKDFARGYLFYARITNPVTALDQNHPYLVNSTTLPTQTIEAITSNWQGNEYKIGGVSTFAELTISFKCDTAQELRSDFLKWMKKIHDPVSNVHGTPSEYFGQVDLSQLNSEGRAIMSYSLINAWPSAVGEITLDYGTKEISTFDVTFTYQYHTVDNIFGDITATRASV